MQLSKGKKEFTMTLTQGYFESSKFSVYSYSYCEPLPPVSLMENKIVIPDDTYEIRQAIDIKFTIDLTERFISINILSNDNSMADLERPFGFINFRKEIEQVDIDMFIYSMCDVIGGKEYRNNCLNYMSQFITRRPLPPQGFE